MNASADDGQDPAVSEWLNTLSPRTIDHRSKSHSYDLPVIGSSSLREAGMESSSSLSLISTNANDDTSTVRDSDKNARALNWEKLRFRRIFKTATEDVKSKELKLVLSRHDPKLPFKNLSDLVVLLEQTLQDCKKSRPAKDSSSLIEKFKEEFHEWQSEHRVALMTNREFDMDVSYSMSANEAVLQRTIMPSIIDRFSINDLFSFNCEGQWKLYQRHRLPSTGRIEHVTMPKPDLAIFFRLNALTGANIWASYPREIAGCLRPDGGEERCFPFFFMEVKRSADNLEAAFRANLHSASQALYNIFQWMSLVDLDGIFFQKVRVFSMDLNAQEVKVRAHRAMLDHNNSLSFHFDDLTSLSNYTRDQVCQLVKSVLLDYARNELHDILKNAFQKVSEKEQSLAQEEAKSRNKRRINAPESRSSKRGRSHADVAVPPLPTTVDAADDSFAATSSFGASGLAI